MRNVACERRAGRRVVIRIPDWSANRGLNLPENKNPPHYCDREHDTEQRQTHISVFTLKLCILIEASYHRLHDDWPEENCTFPAGQLRHCVDLVCLLENVPPGHKRVPEKP